MPPILEVRHLRITLPPRRDAPAATVVRDVSFSVDSGRCTMLVGESGCGKSLSSLSLVRLPPVDRAEVAGSIRFEGRELTTLPPRELRALRGRRIAYVFQDPGEALNPVLRVRTQLLEALPRDTAPSDRIPILLDLLRQCRIPDPERVLRSYPHELSGGMQQRAMIAMALAARPALLVADEPTSALDATTQTAILDLIADVRRERGLSVLLVTHNLGVFARYADRGAILYAGETVEEGPADALVRSPAHPYTRGLLRAVPRLSMAGVDDLRGIPGRVPPPSEWGDACLFAPRCPFAAPACRAAPAPSLREVTGGAPGHRARCPLSHTHPGDTP